MSDNRTVLAVGAHPDDIEFLCAGTLALLKDKGWKIHIATMTLGDKGSVEHTSEEIAAIRKKEAAKSAFMLDAGYDCIEGEDMFLFYTKEMITRVTKLIRKIKPQIIFNMSPSDYHPDHEMSSKIVVTACFSAGIKLLETDGVEAYDYIPYLYYMDPLDGKDNFGNEIKPGIVIDISGKIDIKEKMLACHSSQREWLRKHHGVDEYIIAMKNISSERGKMINKKYGEGFRQHLGHAFPQDDILKSELNGMVYTI